MHVLPSRTIRKFTPVLSAIPFPVPKVTLQLARAAKLRAADLLGDLPGVVGIGLTRTARGGYGLRINLDRPPPRNRPGGLPKAIDGVPVAFEVVGRVRPR